MMFGSQDNQEFRVYSLVIKIFALGAFYWLLLTATPAVLLRTDTLRIVALSLRNETETVHFFYAL